MLRKGMLGPRNPVFIYLLEHPFFFGEEIQRIIQARGFPSCADTDLKLGSFKGTRASANGPRKLGLCSNRLPSLSPLLDVAQRLESAFRPEGPERLSCFGDRPRNGHPTRTG